MDNYDLIVIGGGPGGYVAAIRAAQLGKKVALVEKEHLGGICLNWGCIPTKALLKSAELFQKMKHCEDFGIEAQKITPNISKIVKRSREISAKLTAGVSGLLKKNKVTVINGLATFESANILSVTNDGKKTQLQAKNIIIATGAGAKVIPGYEPDGKNIWSYREALVPNHIPSSIIIVGSGAIGIEFASFYNAMGTKIIVLEAADRILQAEDAEISALAQKSFTNKGIEFYTKIKLLSKEVRNNKVMLKFEHNGAEKILESEILLMAVGISPNTKNLGLEKTKVKLDERGHIITDSSCKTAENNIYAIGDVTGAPWLAHKASHEGIIAAEVIAGQALHPIKRENIPACTYSSPQIASVGLTEEAAKKLGYQVKVGKFPFMANGKALTLGEEEGMVKTVFDEKTGELLGAHMIGAEVTELIQGYAIAKTMEGTELELMATIFPHPTLSEMMHESVLQAYGKAIHI